MAMVSPSGENEGRPGANRSSRIVRVSPVARSTIRTPLWSPWTDVKTMCAPSGENTGPTSPPGSVVAWRSAPVSMSRTQMSSVPPLSEA